MDRKEFDKIIEEPFNVPDLANMWEEILNVYKMMGFSIPLTDKERGTPLSDNDMIREFQWIYGQYKKFIGTKKSSILSTKDNLNKTLMVLENLIEKNSESPSDRPTIVYQLLKSRWLHMTWNHIAWMIEEIAREEDDNG